MRIRILKPLPRYKVGQIIDVHARDGIPLDLYLRRRLKDGECEIVTTTKRNKEQKQNGQHSSTTAHDG